MAGWPRCADRDDFRALLAQAEAAASGRTINPVSTSAADRHPRPTPGPRPSHGNDRRTTPSVDRISHGVRWPPADTRIGIAQLELGRFEEASATLGRVLATREALVRDHPEDVRYRADLAATRTAIARLEWRTDRLDAAIRSWDEIRQDLESDLMAARTTRSSPRS